MSEKEKKNAFFFSFQNEGRVITASVRKNYCKARRRLRLYSFLHLYAAPHSAQRDACLSKNPSPEGRGVPTDYGVT